MTVTYSNLTLACAALAMGLAVTPAPLLAQQQRASDEHVRDLAQQAARLVAGPQS